MIQAPGFAGSVPDRPFAAHRRAAGASDSSLVRGVDRGFREPNDCTL